MEKDRFFNVEREARRYHDEFWLDTIRFFRNSNEIYARYDEWKNKDRFYFIPLRLQMFYSIGGFGISMCNSPIYLGSFIRNTFKHEDLFTTPCPNCGRKLYPFGYNGSPLSGRVDLEATCPNCGWDEYVIVSGWKVRSEALKATQKEDEFRLLKAKIVHPRFKAASIQSLLEWLRR